MNYNDSNIDNDDSVERRSFYRNDVPFDICESGLCCCAEEGDRGFEAGRPVSSFLDCSVCTGRRMIEVGVLRNCRHVFCIDCLVKWRLVHRNLTCPLCNQLSYTALYSNGLLTAGDKTSAFRRHLKCLTANDPFLANRLAGLNDLWLRLVETMLSTECHGLFKGIETLDLRNYGRPIRSGKSFAIFGEEADPDRQHAVICCKMENFSLRLGIFPESMPCPRADDDYADDVVAFFNRQLKDSWRALPYVVNDVENRKVIVRKFEKVTCVLFVVGVRTEDRSKTHGVPVKELLKEANFERDDRSADSIHFALPFHLCSCSNPDCTKPRVRRMKPRSIF